MRTEQSPQHNSAAVRCAEMRTDAQARLPAFAQNVQTGSQEGSSLFGEVLDWIMVALLLVFPASLVFTWVTAHDLADKPFDRALEQDVQALARLVSVEGRHTVLNFAPSARHILRTDEADEIYYQIRGLWGELIAGERVLPPPAPSGLRQIDQVQMRSIEFKGRMLRVAHVWTLPQRLSQSSTQEAAVLVQLGETLNKRHTLTAEIIKGASLPQMLLLPLVVMLVWLALSRGIRPLHVLEQKIRHRGNEDTSPIEVRGVPQEVAPLIVSINDLLRRLQYSIDTQKRFLTDAAHQLKTPLAGLRMQADLALRAQASAEDLKHSLRLIGRSSIRATHTVNQLLALARAEATGQEITKAPVQLAAMVREVLDEVLPQALEKHMDIGLEDDSVAFVSDRLLGNAVLLKELVRNLVENAINYTQEAGVITVRVFQESSSAALVLQVQDNGPGIAEHERELVMRPFYRVNNNLQASVDGSGLGLAIVHTIARQHHAQVSVEDAKTPPQGVVGGTPGTLFSVRFARPEKEGHTLTPTGHV